jgi:hypothetical protein
LFAKIFPTAEPTAWAAEKKDIEALYVQRFALSLESLARSHNPPKKLIRNQALSAGSDSDTTY